jgi:GTP-binding protein
MLLDEVTLFVKSGKGGDGMSCFRREKHVPLGGPDGGNGGKGADVAFRVNEQFNTLLDLGYDRKFMGEDGKKGGTQKRTGRSGKTLYIDVPKGTLIKNAENEILADLTSEGQIFIAVAGGRGGRGNFTYKHSTNQAPEYSQPGKPAEELTVCLELKMMADVGLVGFPNAGKSSIVNKISSAQPKVGDYPFTTLEPILGIVKMSDYGSFVIADIPGLIEGAADGKGLGHQFLKHIERTYCLLFVMDGFRLDALEQFKALQKELKNFHPKLAEKPFVVALNKSDLDVEPALSTFREAGVEVVVTSAYSGNGCKKLIRKLEEHVRPVSTPIGAW